MKRQFGDVLEIPVRGGFAYAIYTHKHPDNGDLLRIYTGIFGQRPNIDLLVDEGRIKFSCFTPLKRFIADGFGSVVGNSGLPTDLAAFPIFRTGNADHLTGELKSWWLWNGSGEWRADSISEEELGYPVNGVWGAELVVARIGEGWEQYAKAF